MTETEHSATDAPSERPALFVAGETDPGQAATEPEARLVLSLETCLHAKAVELDMGLGSRLQAFNAHGCR